MPTKKDKLTIILEDLQKTGNVEGSAVLSRDGLVIASKLEDTIDEESFAAMSAAMTGAAETALQELRKDAPERVIVESRTTKLITVGAGEKAILACTIKSGSNLGLILLQMKKATAKIKKEIK